MLSTYWLAALLAAVPIATGEPLSPTTACGYSTVTSVTTSFVTISQRAEEFPPARSSNESHPPDCTCDQHRSGLPTVAAAGATKTEDPFVPTDIPSVQPPARKSDSAHGSSGFVTSHYRSNSKKAGPRFSSTKPYYPATKSNSGYYGTATGALRPSSTTRRSTPIATGTSSTGISSSSSGGRKNMLYFGAWSIYNQKFRPQDIDVKKVTHILYAFGDIAFDGSVISADPYADVQIRFPEDGNGGWDSKESNAYGNIKQLYLLKKKNRHLKTLLSIGGWTYSQAGKFRPAANTAQAREKFASSAVKLMSDWGFDGLDVDWEYPESDTEANDFVLLLKACREALDKYAAQNDQTYHYPLSIAVSAGPAKYKFLDMKSIDKYVDSWHLMAYDYAGSWDKTTGHTSNLFHSNSNPESTKFDTNRAVQDYIDGGVPSKKLVLGMPLYGRAFLNTAEKLGQAYQGVPTDTGSDPGVWLYRDLPRKGASVSVDRKAVGAWSYDPSTKELVSFDNPETGKIKAEYIRNHGLGGAMFWEAAGDKKGEDSLVNAVGSTMGKLSAGKNMLDYPKSQYDNIRNGMKK